MHRKNNVENQKTFQEYTGIKELEMNEMFLKNYNNDIVKKISSVRRGSNIEKILEFGAGLGTLATIYHNIFGIKPICIEIDPILKKNLEERGFTVFSDITETNHKFNLIYTSNVLEHIEEDQLILNNLYEKLENGGVLSIYVPAFKFLYSHMDKKVGHIRRYTKKDLFTKLNISGYKIIKFNYCDTLGFFAWIYEKYNKKNVNCEQSSKKLKIFDRFIYPVSRILDEIGFKYLFGKNILIIARK